MAMGRPKAALVLSPEQRAQLESMASSRSLPAGLVTRVRIVLLSAAGKMNQQIARQLGLTNATVGKWRRRFVEQAVSGLHDELRPGRPRPISDAVSYTHLTRPLRLSHMSEGDLIRKTQPAYPAIARSARIQGIVVVQAIISKQGTIENVTVLTGHPMLIPAAIDAVRQWRYRPYILNNEPVEVETQITVNFSLAGN